MDRSTRPLTQEIFIRSTDLYQSVTVTRRPSLPLCPRDYALPTDIAGGASFCFSFAVLTISRRVLLPNKDLVGVLTRGVI
ncbi:hypothetical protein ARMSODRAFT_966943, partial [Armillaria solidipes]